MEEFLNKYAFLHIEVNGRDLYYLCALVTSVTDTHISFLDKKTPYTYRKIDIVEIKLSNRDPKKEGFDGL